MTRPSLSQPRARNFASARQHDARSVVARWRLAQRATRAASAPADRAVRAGDSQSGSITRPLAQALTFVALSALVGSALWLTLAKLGGFDAF